MNSAKTEEGYKDAAEKFKAIKDFGDSLSLAEKCMKKAEEQRKNTILSNAKNKMNQYFNVEK